MPKHFSLAFSSAALAPDSRPKASTEARADEAIRRWFMKIISYRGETQVARGGRLARSGALPKFRRTRMSQPSADSLHAVEFPGVFAPHERGIRSGVPKQHDRTASVRGSASCGPPR